VRRLSIGDKAYLDFNGQKQLIKAFAKANGYKLLPIFQDQLAHNPDGKVKAPERARLLSRA